MVENGNAATGIDCDAWRRRIRADAFSNYHFSMAQAIAREGDSTAAIEHLRHAIAADAAMGPAYFELAALLRADGRGSDADEVERQAQAACPNYAVEGSLQRGIELARADREAGMALLLQTAERFPAIRDRAFAEVGELHLARAMEMASETSDGVLEALKAAEPYAPANTRLLFQLCRCHRNRNELPDAAYYALKTLEHAEAPERATYLFEAVAVLCMRLQTADAARVLAHAVSAHPAWVEPKAILGQVLVTLGRFDEARATARAASEQDPGSVEAATKLGEVLWAIGDAQGAADAFALCLDRAAGASRARSGLAMIHAEAGRHAEAVSMARAAVAAPEASIWHLTNLALVLEAAGLADEAAQTFRRLTTGDTPAFDPRFLWYHAKLRPRYEARLATLLDRLGLPRPA